MTGITDLSALLASMKPSLSADEFVYCTVSSGSLERYLPLQPVGFFREEEGMTLILLRSIAEEAGFSGDIPMRCITLTVNSSLEAVGLTAALSAALTADNISANVVAAYYHDHIFVPSADAERALAALEALSARST